MADSRDLRIAILGAGSWGTTLAKLLVSPAKSLTLWTHSSTKAAQLTANRRLSRPLEFTLPEEVEITSDINKAVEAADILIFAVSSQHMRQVGQMVHASLQSRQAAPILVSVAKGLELDSLYRMSEVLNEVIPGGIYCALSGPNLAVEILQGLPTAAVIAGQTSDHTLIVQQCLTRDKFRLYRSDDLVGVELGGTLKNIMAVAAGCCDGLNLGANARAALLTRGLAEMNRLALALGARSATLFGLSGMGDLIATATSDLSRNYRLGLALGRGDNLTVALEGLGGTAEAVPTTQAVCSLAAKLNLNLPIAEQVELVLKGTSTPTDAIMSLMSRPLSSE